MADAMSVGDVKFAVPFCFQKNRKQEKKKFTKKFQEMRGNGLFFWYGCSYNEEEFVQNNRKTEEPR